MAVFSALFLNTWNNGGVSTSVVGGLSKTIFMLSIQCNDIHGSYFEEQIMGNVPNCLILEIKNVLLKRVPVEMTIM